jgi:RNA polymerase sigma-70 factor (ECF subfamily)
MFNETDVIARLRNGDSTALQEIREEYGKALTKRGRRLNPYDDNEVEDAVAHAFIKLWEKHADFEKMRSVKAFLFTVLQNKTFDQLRRRKKEMEYIKSNHSPLTEERENYEERLEWEELLNLLPAAIEALDDRSKQILRLSMSGMKSKEIGEKFGIGEDAVNTINRRTRIKLKEIITDQRQGRGPSMFTIIMLLKLIVLN